jgi:NhaP-type Na+/H+ or K+/H+ antiporter
MTSPRSASQIFVGLALTVGLAVGCQVIATKLKIPAIILLPPVGFVEGWLTTDINPDKLFGATFPPLVSLAVAIILFDGGLDLTADTLKDDRHLVVRVSGVWASRSPGRERATSPGSCSACLGRRRRS